MAVSDLVYKLDEKSLDGGDLWGIHPYFCPTCGHLNMGGYVTEILGNEIFGAYGSYNAAMTGAERIFRDPECFSCMYDWAKEKAKELMNE